MTEERAAYAGFWRRAAALILDNVLLAFVTNPIYFQLVNQFQASRGRGIEAYEESHQFGAMIFGFIWYLVMWSYYAGMESSPLRATLGKLALGIRVTAIDGSRLSYGRATGRFFGRLVSGAILGIGYLMAGFTARKQALHDLMAGTLVVQKN
jgi:uncharacterized RDD family membrane protein YckC